MIPHVYISMPESMPEIEASPLIFALVEEAFESFGKRPQSITVFQKRLQSLSEEDLGLASDYIHFVRKNSILNECVQQIEAANQGKDVTLASIERITAHRDLMLQIAVFLREMAEEERLSRSLKRAEDLKNRTIEFVTLGHVMLHGITTLTQGEVQNIMRQPRRAEDSLH
ncbi:MAG: hypothetical protein NTX63_03935 [Candidatus Peregrinibacteria bacterium]|nr:hypothetical protein [Candidatus Peregrinibacteria bacterium]